MKTLLLALSIITIALYGCKKDYVATSVQGRYLVSGTGYRLLGGQWDTIYAISNDTLEIFGGGKTIRRGASGVILDFNSEKSSSTLACYTYLSNSGHERDTIRFFKNDKDSILAYSYSGSLGSDSGSIVGGRKIN